MTPIERAREAARSTYYELGAEQLDDPIPYAIAAYEADLSAQGLVIVPKAELREAVVSDISAALYTIAYEVLQGRGEDTKHASANAAAEAMWLVSSVANMIAASPHNSNPTQGDKADSN